MDLTFGPHFWTSLQPRAPAALLYATSGGLSRWSGAHIAKVGFGTKPASWILVWLRAHGSFPGFVRETPRRGRLKRKARGRRFCIVYRVISWPGFVLSPTFWRKQSTMSGFVHLIIGKRGVYNNARSRVRAPGQRMGACLAGRVASVCGRSRERVVLRNTGDGSELRVFRHVTRRIARRTR